MFATISKEQYNTFLTGKIPDSIPQEMKDFISSLKQSDGGNAYFNLSSCQPWFLNDGSTEYYIEYVCPEDAPLLNAIML